jgi:hypothetical protein
MFELIELHSSPTPVQIQRLDTHVNSDLVPVLEAIRQGPFYRVDADVRAIE